MILSGIEERELNRYLQRYDFNEYINGKTFLLTGCKGLVGSGVIKWLLLENKKNDANVTIIAST